jgi:hypothetical protein
MMDPSQDAKYAGASSIRPAAATGVDARLASDFTFHNGVIGDPARGIWMQSPWSHKRYVGHARTSPTSARTAVPYIIQAENDLLIAEALIRTSGDLARAATLINKTRVNRGQLAPAAAADGAAKLLQYIRYEQIIELMNTNGMSHFRERHWDGFQEGTFRHLPIPARELETLSLPLYTFGGVGKPGMRIKAPNGEVLQLRKAPKPRRIRTEAFDM